MITPAQSRGARGILDWTQDRLATEAGVSLSTVKDFEAGRRTPIGNNLAALKRALEDGGVEFTDGDRPGVRLGDSPPSKPGARKKAAAKPRRPSKGRP
jgi:transcriptional regulator with XRE-family HTH domain